ncbi:MAG: cardiolipin synthase [Treponema sp.]|nr:cardiolipin synthase [Treponema sp.]
MTTRKQRYVRSNIGRFFVAVIFISIQITWIVLMFMKLNESFKWVSIAIKVGTAVLVLYICSVPKNASVRLMWIVFIAFFPIFGITMYLMIELSFATGAMKKRYKKTDAQLFPFLPQNNTVLHELEKEDVSAANMARYLHVHTGFPVYSNTDITYFPSAEEAFIAQKEAMRHAQQFIFMEYFIIEDAESFQEIEAILEQKVQEGVEVRIFYDDIGSIKRISRKFNKRMQAKGIRCHTFNPIRPVFNMFLNYRDHRKMTIIDGKIGFTGGYNIANEYFNIVRMHGHWKDSGIKLTGEAVKSLTCMFLEMWNAVNSRDADDADFSRYFPKSERIMKRQGYVQPYSDSPLDNEHTSENVYLNIINNAEKYCYIMTPYLIIMDEMTKALCLAAKRGVDVRIITPGIPDKKLVHAATHSYYGQLINNGVQIYEYTEGFCHAKMCIADNKNATCGTINLDYRSLYHNFENGVFMHRTRAVRAIKKDFDSLFPQCENVGSKYNYKKHPYRLKVLQICLRLVSPLL